MGPFIISTVLLVLLTVVAVAWFKKAFFKIKSSADLFDENTSAFDKALMTKDPDISIYRHRRYFSAVAGFITMIFIVAFVEYPTLLEKLEEKADARVVQSITQDIKITEQKPEKPKVKKQNKPRREEIVDKPVDIDSTDQKELEVFIPDFGPDEEEEEEEEEYVPPVVDRAEIRAQFPGGPAAFMQWAYNNIVIPEADKQKGARGMVMVEFVVYEDGFLRDIKIIKGISPSMDKAVMELMESSPKWSTASTQGQSVRERWRYPIKIVPKS